jgi:Type I restriction enzyme R protein N terminus (HSDR_N)
LDLFWALLIEDQSIALKLTRMPTMFKIPKKVLDRLSDNLKKFQPIASSHKSRDVSEADTVTLVKDMLADMFGFDKYSELTSEQQIKGTFCDLAVRIGERIKFLIEVKAAGVVLNDSHLRQAINYGANQGIEWIALTNSIQWKIYRIKFAQPIECEEVTSFEINSINPRSAEDQTKLFLLCREGIASDAMDQFHQHAMLLNRFTVSQVLLLEPVMSILRREFRKLFPDIKVDVEQLTELVKSQVLKREVVEGDKATEATQRIRKLTQKAARAAAKNELKQQASKDLNSSPSTDKEEGS